MMTEGFAGWMVWNFDLDDFNAQHCGPDVYPLINAMNDALTGTPPTTTSSTTSEATSSASSGTTTTTNGGGMPDYDGETALHEVLFRDESRLRAVVFFQRTTV